MQGLNEGAIGSDLRVNFQAVIVIICQRRINLGQPQPVFTANLVGCPSEPLMPDGDVLHGNPAPCDPWLAVPNPWGGVNVPVDREC